MLKGIMCRDDCIQSTILKLHSAQLHALQQLCIVGAGVAVCTASSRAGLPLGVTALPSACARINSSITILSLQHTSSLAELFACCPPPLPTTPPTHRCRAHMRSCPLLCLLSTSHVLRCFCPPPSSSPPPYHPQMSGTIKVDGSGNVELTEEDGIDYAPVTVQLPGGERVPFLFTVKNLQAKGTLDAFGGEFTVPSYRGSTFLDPKVGGWLRGGGGWLRQQGV